MESDPIREAESAEVRREKLIKALKSEAAKNGGQGAYAWRARELCGQAAEALAALQSPPVAGGSVGEELRDALKLARAHLLNQHFSERSHVIEQIDAAFAKPTPPASVSGEVALKSPSGPYVMSDAAREKIATLKAKPSASGHVRFGAGSTSDGGPGAWIVTDGGITVSENMLRSAVTETVGEWVRPMLQAFSEVLPRYVAWLTAAPEAVTHIAEHLTVANATPSAVGALGDIAAERARQIEAEGWTPEHDDEHATGEMALAAACYAASSTGAVKIERSPWWDIWPWDLAWWKPKGARADLVRAGALIVAEIERLDRAALATGETSPDRGAGE